MHEQLKRDIEQLADLRPGANIVAEAAHAPAVAAWREDVGRAAEYMVMFDLELRVTFVNHAQPGVVDPVGSPVLDWIAVQDRESVLRTTAAAYVTGLPHYYETWGTGPHGQSVGYRSWVIPLSHASGVQAFVVISNDISHVDRVERKLADQTSVLDTLVKHAPDNVMIIDRQHRIEFSNHLLAQFDTSEVLGKVAESFLPEAEQARVSARFDRIFATGESASYEVWMDIEGGTRWYSTRAGPIFQGDQIERILLVSTEITAAKRKEAAEAKEKALLDAMERIDRQILAASDLHRMIDAVLRELLDIFGGIRSSLSWPCVSDAATWSLSHESKADDQPSLLGLSPRTTSAYRAYLETLLNTPGADVWAPPDAARSNDPLWGHGVRAVLAMALRPQSGAPWLLSLHSAQEGDDFRDKRALFEALGARLCDGLKSLLAQRDLRQSEERFRTLVEHAPEAIVILDVDAGRFVESNAKAEKMFGWSRAQLLGMHLLDLSPELQPDGRRSDEGIGARVRRAMAGEIPTFEWVHLHSTGRSFFCEVCLVRLPHPERKLIRGSITDIGARKRAEEDNRTLAAQLAQAQKMQAIGQLTGGIAHDFNNLLTVIIGSLTLMEVDGVTPAMVRELAQQADAAAQRAAALTQRLLAFSRRQPLRPQGVALPALLGGMEQLLRRTLHENIELSFVVEEDTWVCEADPVQLESAVLNLAINARDAMPKGGVLRISAQNAGPGVGQPGEREDLSGGDYVRIAVMDNGSGMTPEVLAQAFEPFFTTKDVGQGSGLGLSMVYGFVKQSGGQIKIASTPGKGTEVVLHLPRSKRNASAPGLPPVGAERGRGQLLLVVEDDPGVRHLVCEMLHRLGYQTVAAEDAQAALKLLAQRRDVALMLSDMALPGGMSGAELVGIVRGDLPELPILFMTGYSTDALANDHALQGVQLLSKPFSKAALAAAVCDALRDADGKR